MDDDWQPLSTLPTDRAMWVTIRTPRSSGVHTWRWLPYGRGSQWPYIGGRWQSATEYGFKNDTLPTVGEWQPNRKLTEGTKS